MWQIVTVGVYQFYHLFNGDTQLRINLGLIIAVNAARHDFRTAPDEALVFLAPLQELRVASGVRFDFFTCHIQSSFAGFKARFTSRS